MVAVAALLSLWLAVRSDAWTRRRLVGRWHCANFYSSPGDLVFLGGGSYAEVVLGPAGKVAEFGTWDVANGELIEIVDHGDGIKDSMSYALVEVAITGSEFTLRKSNGGVGARCSRVAAGTDP